MQLSLDCLTLTDSSPEELIAAAAEAGFDLVSLWVSPLAAFPRQVLRPDMAEARARQMAAAGIRAHQIEVFDLASREAIEAARPLLELGARLGGKSILAYNGSNADRAEVVDLLGRLSRVAGEFGLGVNVEPVSMGWTRTLAEAEALIRDAGIDAGIVFDTLHHVRTGGTAAAIGYVNPGLIRYVQLNDGLLSLPADQWQTEAMAERLYPGEGEFPLAELLAAVPRDIPWGIETPSLRRAAAGRTPAEQAMEAMAAMRALLATLPR